MNTDKLRSIIGSTTVLIQEGSGFSTLTTDTVDCHFVKVGVNKYLAESRKEELISLLKTYPDQERLKGGPGYIEVGGVVGDQGDAFRLFALGEVLGFWEVVTPGRLGIKGEDAKMMAGRGGVMITGFNAANPNQGTRIPAAVRKG